MATNQNPSRRDEILVTDPWASLKTFTAARIALGRTGTAEPLQAMLQFRLAHAHARDAVYATLEQSSLLDALQQLQQPCFVLHSEAANRHEYLQYPDRGRKLNTSSVAQLQTFNYTGKVDWKKLRIAYAANYFKNIPADGQPWKVLETFRGLGAVIKDIEFPDSAIYPFNIMDPVISAESAAAFDELTRSNRDSLIRRQDKNFWPNGFRVSRFIPAVEYINANRHRSTLIAQLNDFMKQYDVVIVPSFAGNQLAMTNLTGHPVVVFPIGFTPEGLPNSITLIGNLYDEATILAVAKAFQEATDFHKKHPGQFK